MGICAVFEGKLNEECEKHKWNRKAKLTIVC